MNKTPITPNDYRELLNKHLNKREKAILRYLYTLPYRHPELLMISDIRNLFAKQLSDLSAKEKTVDPFNDIDYSMYCAPADFITTNDDFLRGLTSEVIIKAGCGDMLTSEFLENNPEVYDEKYKRKVYEKDVPELVKMLYRQNPRKWHIAFANSNNRNVNIPIEKYIQKNNKFFFYIYYWLHYYKVYLEQCLAGKLNIIDMKTYIMDLYKDTELYDEPSVKGFKGDFEEHINVLSIFDQEIRECYGIVGKNGRYIPLVGFVTYVPVPTNTQFILETIIFERSTIWKCFGIATILYVGYRLYNGK